MCPFRLSTSLTYFASSGVPASQVKCPRADLQGAREVSGGRILLSPSTGGAGTFMLQTICGLVWFLFLSIQKIGQYGWVQSPGENNVIACSHAAV